MKRFSTILAALLLLPVLSFSQTIYVPDVMVTTLAGYPTPFDKNGQGTAAGFNSPNGIAVDATGNLYIADTDNNKIRKITPGGLVSTLAGSGQEGYADGQGTNASFYKPYALAVDASGNIYVADTYNNIIRKITAAGLVSTIAGTSGIPGSSDGQGTAAGFNNPYGIAVDVAGTIYVADANNNKIRKITPGGLVSTMAGSNTAGSADGQGNAAGFNQPSGIGVDVSGNVYVADTWNYEIRKISPSGLVSTLAGSTKSGNSDGQGVNAQFNNPTGIAVDASGTVYVADNYNSAIREISPNGFVSTLGNASNIFYLPFGVAVDAFGYIYVADTYNNEIRKITPVQVSTLAGSTVSGNSNGQGSSARFNNPHGIIIDALGNKYIADMYNNIIRKITPGGLVSTLAGSGIAGSIDGQGVAASFNGPTDIAFDLSGNLYVSDTYNNKIRIISPTGLVSTFAGSTIAGSTDGQGTAAGFNMPRGITMDASGNLFVADYGNSKIRMITADGLVSTLAPYVQSGTNGQTSPLVFIHPQGITSYYGNIYVADSINNNIIMIQPNGSADTLAGSIIPGRADGVRAAAGFNGPTDLAVDASGNLYLADTYNNEIRKINSSGLVSTVAGFSGPGSTNGEVTIASFNSPAGIAVDDSGNVYVSDTYNNQIRKISSNIVSIVAGNSMANNVNGQGSSAGFYDPEDLTVDASGNIYVADTYNNQIRKITPDGLVSTPLFTFEPGNTINENAFIEPFSLVMDASGNLLIAVSGGSTISKVSPNGLISTVAGSSTGGITNGQGTAATFNIPEGIAVDASGTIYVADTYNNAIRKITPTGLVSTFAGSGTTGSGDGQGTDASFNHPTGIVLDASGNVYIGDTENNEIRKITPGGLVSTFAGATATGDIDGQGTTARFNWPQGLAIDDSGNVYVADALNNKIRKITPGGLVCTLAGSSAQGSTDGIGSQASFYWPNGIAFDASGNLYVADTWNNEIRKITIGGSSKTATVNDIKTSTISVFPNPAKDVLNVSLSENINGTLSMADVQGNEVLNQTINSKQVSISTASLPSGMYLLKIVSTNASYVNKVMIVR
jgi:sugar lactone lactonase YvrE